jgi:hypothetical protein
MRRTTRTLKNNWRYLGACAGLYQSLTSTLVISLANQGFSSWDAIAVQAYMASLVMALWQRRSSLESWRLPRLQRLASKSVEFKQWVGTNLQGDGSRLHGLNAAGFFLQQVCRFAALPALGAGTVSAILSSGSTWLALYQRGTRVEPVIEALATLAGMAAIAVGKSQSSGFSPWLFSALAGSVFTAVVYAAQAQLRDLHVPKETSVAMSLSGRVVLSSVLVVVARLFPSNKTSVLDAKSLVLMLAVGIVHLGSQMSQEAAIGAVKREIDTAAVLGQPANLRGNAQEQATADRLSSVHVVVTVAQVIGSYALDILLQRGWPSALEVLGTLIVCSTALYAMKR